MNTRMSVLDLVNALPAADRRKLIAQLRKDEISPCEQRGHSYKPTRVIAHLFAPPTTTMVCTKCGSTITV